ncbi:MAG TPA: TonB-dependent receptor [Gemmatimonadota bacterium]
MVLAAGALPARLAAQGPAALFGRVSDEAGLPVAGALVRLEGTGLEAAADAEGRYRIAGLRPGRFRLVADAPSFRTRVTEVSIPRDGESLRIDVRLAAEPLRMAEVLTQVERPRRETEGRWTLTREDLERAGSLARALARVPGVFVKEYGAGGPQEVSIRGGSPDQTLLLWDEEPLLAPAGGAVDLRTLPWGAIDSVQVIAVGASSRYGPGALAGVVRVHPATAADAPHSLGGGAVVSSLGSRGASGRVAVTSGGAAFTGQAGVREFDDSFGERENAGGDERDAAFSLALAGTGVGLATSLFDAERGAPGPVYDPTPEAQTDSRRGIAGLTLERAWGSWSLRGQAGFQAARASYEDAARPALAAESRETAFSLRAGATRELAAHRLEAGLAARRLSAHGTGLGEGASREELGLYVSDRWRAPGALGLTLSPALRLDRLALTDRDEPDVVAEDREDIFLSPSLAAALELGKGFALRAQAGRSFRYPDLQDLFFLPGVGVRSNPRLREERSRDVELAADWSPTPALRASAAVFDRRIDGAIVWLPDFQFVWSPRNLPRAVAHGVELAASWRPHGSWELNGTYAYAPSRFDFAGNHNPLPYRPAHLGRLEVAGGAGPLRSALEARLTGRRYPNLAGTNALEGYVLVDWSVEWRLDVPSDMRVALELDLENMLDRDYDVVFGFPGAGRSVAASVRVEPR